VEESAVLLEQYNQIQNIFFAVKSRKKGFILRRTFSKGKMKMNRIYPPNNSLRSSSKLMMAYSLKQLIIKTLKQHQQRWNKMLEIWKKSMSRFSVKLSEVKNSPRVTKFRLFKAPYWIPYKNVCSKSTTNISKIISSRLFKVYCFCQTKNTWLWKAKNEIKCSVSSKESQRMKPIGGLNYLVAKKALKNSGSKWEKSH